MADQKLMWDDGTRMVVTVAGKIYTLTWIDAEEVAKDDNHPDPYLSGWYYDEDGPPGYMGVTRDEVKANVRECFARKQQNNAWRDEDLLYALCVVCKHIDLYAKLDERLTVEEAFGQAGYGPKETAVALDLIYQKVLE